MSLPGKTCDRGIGDRVQLLLVINHTVLMTTTELTRLKYDLKATPEEWAASDHNRADITAEAETELERQHNAHRNATENTVYFAMLAITLGLISLRSKSRRRSGSSALRWAVLAMALPI